MLRNAETSAVKVITPVLPTAALPVVEIWGRIIKFYAAIFPCPKQHLGEEEKSVPPLGIGHICFCIQHTPFDGAVIPCAKMNIVIAAVCTVITADPTCANLYGFFYTVIIGKGGCGQKTQYHAAYHQDAEYSFLHWLVSSCSYRFGLSAPSFFWFSLILSRKHRTVITTAAAKETMATST